MRTASSLTTPARGPAQSAVAYLGATEGELRTARRSKRLLAGADQRMLFPHRGTLLLTSDALALEGWRTLTPAQVASVALTFTDVYSRWLAGGVRGNAVSFGVFGSLGKPVVLTLLGDDPIYLLIDYRWITGTNRARAWLPTIANWARGTASR